MKRVLITGGAGFLGSHLCERLLAVGCHVVCVDNLSTSKIENVKCFFTNPNFKFILHDIIEPLHVEVEQIYNLACPASPVHYQLDPIKTLKTCFLGVMNMLELAKKLNARILHASTSEIYGDPDVHPQPEDYRGSVNPIGIRACYDEGKRSAETLCFDYHRRHDIDIKIIRVFNTYGPRMAAWDGRVVSNFIVQALGNNDITVYGTGSQTRSFCYVDDLIDGIIRMMNSRDGFTGPVNLGNPYEFTVLELANLVIGLTGSASKIAHKPLPQDDPAQRRPVIDLAKTELDWKPRIQLETGLKKTIEYFKEKGNI